jgi:hypothetical protein
MHFSRHSQVMTLDDRTVAVYSALSATLLALLPALRYEAERAKEESDTFERVRQAIPVQSAGVADALVEAVVTKDRRSSDARGSGKQTRTAGDDGELGKVLERLDRYRDDLLARERWIRSDLIRRGLLPEYPIWGHR